MQSAQRKAGGAISRLCETLSLPPHPGMSAALLGEQHLQGALAAALASSEEALRRQEIGALLARNSEQLLCASPVEPQPPGSAPVEHSVDLWELARLRTRADTLGAENDALRAQLRLLTARVAQQEHAAQVLCWFCARTHAVLP